MIVSSCRNIRFNHDFVDVFVAAESTMLIQHSTFTYMSSQLLFNKIDKKNVVFVYSRNAVAVQFYPFYCYHQKMEFHGSFVTHTFY